MDDLSALTAPEAPSEIKNWYTTLPEETRQGLCVVRASWNSGAPRCKLRTLWTRLQSKYAGMPKDVKRLSEFLRNEAEHYPEAT